MSVRENERLFSTNDGIESLSGSLRINRKIRTRREIDTFMISDDICQRLKIRLNHNSKVHPKTHAYLLTRSRRETCNYARFHEVAFTVANQVQQ